MKFKKLRKYLMVRVIALAVFETAALLALFVLAFLQSRSGSVSAWLLIGGGAAVAVCGLLWELAVIRPYRKAENEAANFINGYTPEGEMTAAVHQFSPVTEQMLTRVIEQMSPTQMFHQNKRQAQYLALQNQINPHFLYNTLDSIRSEALMAGLHNVADMTEALASFFRYTISKVENLVSVEEELQNCETYFRIQEYRFESRLQMDIECDPSEWEEIRRCRLPKLTLQPLVENAIIHGTELKMGTGKLVIHLERTNKRLLIRVSDNGVGMDEKTLKHLNSRFGKNALAAQREEQRKGGLALVNVDHRIRLLFGDEYGLHIFSFLGVGTDVEVTLPAITSDLEVANREVLQ